jgi:hypothetical protein
MIIIILKAADQGKNNKENKNNKKKDNTLMCGLFSVYSALTGGWGMVIMF